MRPLLTALPVPYTQSPAADVVTAVAVAVEAVVPRVDVSTVTLLLTECE